MNKRVWLQPLLLAAYVLTALAVSGAVWITLQPPAYSPPSLEESAQSQQPGASTGDTTCSPEYVAGLPSPRERLEQAARCQNEHEQHRLSQEDLIQQTRAASAAEANALLSVNQAKIGAMQAAFTSLASFAAALAVFYAAKAARYTQRQVKIAKRTANRQLRAYLIVDAGSAGYDINGVLHISPSLKNVGQTPAHKVRYMADTALLTLEQAKRYDFEVRDAECLSVMTLGGTTPIFMKIDLSPGRTTPEQIRAVLGNSELKLFAFGQVYFEDVFGVEHTTKFCRYAEWSTDAQGAITGHMLWGFNRHNEST